MQDIEHQKNRSGRVLKSSTGSISDHDFGCSQLSGTISSLSCANRVVTYSYTSYCSEFCVRNFALLLETFSRHSYFGMYHTHRDLDVQ